MKKIVYPLYNYIFPPLVLLGLINIILANIAADRVSVFSILLILFLFFFLKPIYSIAYMLTFRIMFDDTHLVARSLLKKEVVLPYSAINKIGIESHRFPYGNSGNFDTACFTVYYPGGKLHIPGFTNSRDLVTAIEQYKDGHSEVPAIWGHIISPMSKKNAQKFYDEYGEENLKNEMQTRTIRRHITPNNRGEVYFTDRLVIDLYRAVFPYQDIVKIRVCNTIKARQAALIFTLKNGEEVVLCEDTREDETLRQDMLTYIKICKERNAKIEVDTKDFNLIGFIER